MFNNCILYSTVYMHIYIYICMSYVLKDVYTSTSTDIDTNIIPKRHCLVHSLNIMPLSRDPTFPIELADASSFETHLLWRKGNQLHPMYVCKSSCIRILVLLSFEKKTAYHIQWQSWSKFLWSIVLPSFPGNFTAPNPQARNLTRSPKIKLPTS